MNQHHLQQGMNVVTSGAAESGMNGMQANDGAMFICLNGEYHPQSQQQYETQMLCASSNVDNMMMDNSYHPSMVVSGIHMSNEYLYHQQLPSFDNTASNNAYDINWTVDSSQDAQPQQSQMMWTDQTYMAQAHSEAQQQQQSQPLYHAQVAMVSPPNGHPQMIEAYHHGSQQAYSLMPSQMQQAMQTSSSLAESSAPPTMARSSPSPVATQPAAKGKKRASRAGATKAESKIQKPVSAYALFFRDTQAQIKAENPNAVFGDVSRIVASRWEGLDKASKDVYKERADIEKKNYMATVASTKAKELAEQHNQVGQIDYHGSQETLNLQTQQQQQQQQQPDQSEQSMLPSESMMMPAYASDSSNSMSYLTTYAHSSQHHQSSASSFAHSTMNAVMPQSYAQNDANPMTSANASEMSMRNSQIQLNANSIDSLDIFDSNNLMDLNLVLDEENITNLFGGSGGILSPTSGLDALGTNDYLNDLNTFAGCLNDLETFGDSNDNSVSNNNAFPMQADYTLNSVPHSLPTQVSSYDGQDIKLSQQQQIEISSKSAEASHVKQIKLEPQQQNQMNQTAKGPKVVLKIKLSDTRKAGAVLSSSLAGKSTKDEKMCLRAQCNNLAIQSKQWESKQFCSEDCCVRFCSDAFQNWTQQTKSKNGLADDQSKTDAVSASSSPSLSKPLHTNQRVSIVKTS